MMEMGHNNVEDFLSNIETLNIIKRIRKFNSLNFHTLSKKEIFQEIMNVLCEEVTPGFKMYMLPTNGGTYQANTIFYRVRHLKESPLSNKNLIKYSDLWEPPANCVNKRGRLNEAGESLLYTSPIDPYVAIKESHIKEGEFFILISYRSINPVKVNIIGGEYDYDKLGFTNKTAITNNELYNEFLRDIFSRDVGEGTGYLYALSNEIAKSYFDLPPEVIQDAWAYSSVQDKSKFNVCFRPEIAHKLLKVESASIYKKVSDGNFQFIGVIRVDSDNPIKFLPVEN